MHPQPYICQTSPAQALFPVRMGSFCSGLPASESWTQMNKSGAVRQVLGRGPMGPGLGDAVMSAVPHPACRVM